MTMTTLTDRDRSIIQQVAFKAAVDVARPLFVEDGFTFEQFILNVDLLTEKFNALLLAKHGETPRPESIEAATDNVVSMFPGTAVQDTPAPAEAAAQVPTPQVSGNATAPGITADSNREEQWQNLISGQPKGRINEAEWYDNRRDKKNPAGPDFTHKSLAKGDPPRKLGLWLGGQYPAPAFVTEHFQ